MESWNQAEASVLLWVQENLRIEPLDKFMMLLSATNNAGMLAIVTVIVLLVMKRYRYTGIVASFSLSLEFVVVNLLLKNIVRRIRPYNVNEDLVLLGDVPGDFSFPSGHTGAAFAVAVVMFLCMPKKYGITALVIAVLIAVSRIYNGAHYPTDVLSAIVIATLIAVMAWKLVALIALKQCRRWDK